MSDKRVVVESPLNADTAAGIQRNLRYRLHCLRELRLGGYDPIASHQGAPWYLDDKVPEERELGMHSEWFWQPGVPHLFYTDLGMSGGMKTAWERCYELEIPRKRCALQDWEAFERGEWPPSTAGFKILDAPDSEAWDRFCPPDSGTVPAQVSDREPRRALPRMPGLPAQQSGSSQCHNAALPPWWSNGASPCDRVREGRTGDEWEFNGSTWILVQPVCPDNWQPLPGAAEPDEATP